MVVTERPVVAGQRPRGAADRRAGPRLYLRLFCHFERIIDFDAQVPHGAFKLALSFLLHNDRPCSDPFSVDKISDPQLHEVARSQFTIYGQVKECQFPNAAAELQPDPNRPDVLQAQRRLLPDEFSFVPRPDSRTGLNEVVHGNTPRW